jgi:outer membrane lipoprotein carrier protein
MKRFFIIFFVMVVTLGSSESLFSRSLDSILENIQQTYENTKDYKAEFRQTSFIKSIEEEQQSKGRVYMKKPGRMRWEYLEPEKQLIVLDSKILWIYTQETNQVIKNNFVEHFDSKTPYLFLLGMGKIKEEFDVTRMEEKEDSGKKIVLELKPKEEQPGLRKLVLKVHPKSFQVEGTSIFDDFGNITSFDFYDIQLNSTIPGSLFQFEVPEGAEVVEPPNIQINKEMR